MFSSRRIALSFALAAYLLIVDCAAAAPTLSYKVVARYPHSTDSYRPLLVEIMKFFESGQPPVPNQETLEIFAFMDAAQRSKDEGGKPMRLR